MRIEPSARITRLGPPDRTNEEYQKDVEQMEEDRKDKRLEKSDGRTE